MWIKQNISRNVEEEGNRNITINNEIIEKVNKFKYLGAYVTNRNEVTEEIKKSLASGNACFYSVQKLLSTRLISRKLKLKIYRTVMRVFENKIVRKIYGPKRDEITGEW
jgi:hypothetical protein